MDVESFCEISCLRESGDERYKAFRIEHAIADYLDLLDAFDIKGTFFVLCSSLDYTKEFLARAAERGHEIALHGLTHEIPALMDREDLRAQIAEGKTTLENEFGTEVVGYRAPCFALTDDAVEVLKELGFKYDSSYLDIKMSYCRGGASFGGYENVCGGILKKDGFYEIPPCKLKTFLGQISVSGGAYVRLAPKFYAKRCVEKYIDKSDYYVFYCHPADMFEGAPPKLRGISLKNKYFIKVGRKGFLARTESIIKSLISKGYGFSTMRDFVSSD